jgi:hypothetical protein
MCDYCHKRGHLGQACRIKETQQKKVAITAKKAKTIGKIARTNATILMIILTTKIRVRRAETMTAKA